MQNVFLHIQVQFFGDQEFLGNSPTGKSCQIPLSTKEFSKCRKQSVVFRKADQGFAVGSVLFAQLSWVLGVKFNGMWVRLPPCLSQPVHINRSLSTAHSGVAYMQNGWPGANPGVKMRMAEGGALSTFLCLPSETCWVGGQQGSWFCRGDGAPRPCTELSFQPVLWENLSFPCFPNHSEEQI